MADFPSLPLWTDAYLADTLHLSTKEHGAYLLLLITAWRTPDCSLPDDDKILARYARMDMRGWRHMRPVLEQFFTISQGNWTQKRLQKERNYVSELRRKNADNARSRWLKTNDTDNATAMPNVCQTDAPTPTPTPISISTSVEIQCDKRTSSPKRAVRLDPDWMPSEPLKLYAATKGLTDAEIARCRDDIVDWSVSSPNGAKRDWNATWRTWVRRFADERGNGSGKSGGNRSQPSSVVAAANRHLDRIGRQHSGSGDAMADVWGTKPGGFGKGTVGHNGGDGTSRRGSIGQGTGGPAGGYCIESDD
jgi:uncharacterized protein YdaU (DUF1376 family)